MEKEEIITELLNNSENGLLERLNNIFTTVPNTDLLHVILHEVIKRDQNEVAKVLACIIQLLAVEDSKRASVWEEIKSARLSLKITWEHYFASDIKRRKKKNEKLRNESILHLYKTKQLSIFKAKVYPKLFTLLIKLGADPFELKSSKRDSKTNLTVAILKSKRIKKEATIKILEYMVKNNLITLEPSGRKNISPVQAALKYKKYCLKYLVQTPGFEKVIVSGHTVLEFLMSELNNLLPFFRPEQAAKMFSQKINQQGEIMLSKLSLVPKRHSYEYYQIIKEMMKEDPAVIAARLMSFVSPLYLSFLLYKLGTSENRSGRKLQYFSGDTTFDMTMLQPEIIEMIAMYLKPKEEVFFFSASKSLQSLMQDRWRFLTQRNFPALCKQLDYHPKVTWQEKITPTLKCDQNWKSGAATLKSLKLPGMPVKYSPLRIDEFWLASGISKRILLYNLTDDSHRIIPGKLMEEPRQIHFLNPSPYEPPALLFRTYESFGYWINDQLYTSKYSEVNGLSGHKMIAKISNEKIMVSSHRIYDLNLQQIVPSGTDLLLTFVKLNPFNNTLAARTAEKLLILDSDLRVLNEVSGQNLAATGTTVEFLDEYTLLSSTQETFVTDIRTFKPLLHLPKHLVYNGASRGMYLDTPHTAVICNLQTMSKESVVPCPSGASLYGEAFVCNSKMAVFSVPPNSPSCLSFIV